MSITAHRWLTAAVVAVASACPVILAPPSAAAQASGLTATPATIYYWNDVLLAAFRRQGGGPTPLARAAAMVHAGIFDTLNTAWLVKGEPLFYDHYLLGSQQTDSTVDDDLAAGLVARDLLIEAMPGQQSFVEQKFAERHGPASQPEAEQLAADIVDR